MKIHQVLSLPGTPEADSIYAVLANGSNTVAELYMTDDSGTAKGLVNTAAITDIVNTAVAGFDQFLEAADISARDALTLTKNQFVLVADASADPQVASGAALYAYDESADTYQMLVEFSQLNLDISGIATNASNIATNTANISSNASSIATNASGISTNAAAIALNTADRHTHSNKTQLDLIGESGGFPTYNGATLVTKGTDAW